jgi:hypothetical protein
MDAKVNERLSMLGARGFLLLENKSRIVRSFNANIKGLT